MTKLNAAYPPSAPRERRSRWTVKLRQAMRGGLSWALIFAAGVIAWSEVIRWRR